MARSNVKVTDSRMQIIVRSDQREWLDKINSQYGAAASFVIRQLLDREMKRQTRSGKIQVPT